MGIFNLPLRSIVADMIPKGYTYSQIAARAGVSRSAVAGVVSRMGLRSERPPQETTVTNNIPNDPPLAGSTPTPLLQTTGCRWPVDGGFCNRTLHKKSYCADHYARAYRPAAPIHPLLIKLATLGPQKPKTFAGCQAYNGLVRDRLVMFRVGADGMSTFYLTDLGRENTPGY